tara:strand:+ start:3316 stop:3822 length:507 start_codon:yes stop_codon:yes gene_type:complete
LTGKSKTSPEDQMTEFATMPTPASRSELESTFFEFARRANEAAQTGDWSDWSDMFTDDAHYVEPTYGEFTGRDAIYDWMSKTMASSPGSEMVAFPVHWHIIDQDQGVVVARFGNRLADPGDGSIHEPWNLAILKWGGDGQWASEEDVYDAGLFARTIASWSTIRDELR